MHTMQVLDTALENGRLRIVLPVQAFVTVPSARRADVEDLLDDLRQKHPEASLEWTKAPKAAEATGDSGISALLQWLADIVSVRHSYKLACIGEECLLTLTPISRQQYLTRA